MRTCIRMGSGMGFGPRFSPATLPNLTVCGDRRAMGGALRAELIIGRSAETATIEENSFSRLRILESAVQGRCSW